MSVVPVQTLLAGDGIAVTFDLREDGVYISAECQLGAHHGCPGGIRETAGTPAVICDCPVPTCACCRPLRLHVVPDN